MDRNVFKFSDGNAEVYGDPFRIDRILSAIPPEQFEAMDHPDPAISHPAIEKVIAVGRIAFDLAPFDRKTGTGATEKVVRDALEAFAAYTEKKNVTPATPPTSPPPSDGKRRDPC